MFKILFPSVQNQGNQTVEADSEHEQIILTHSFKKRRKISGLVFYFSCDKIHYNILISILYMPHAFKLK